MPVQRNVRRLPSAAALALVATALAGSTSAFGHESGARPVPGEFRGRFVGVGKAFSQIFFEVVPRDSTSPVVGVLNLSGFVPGVCVKGGTTRVAGRDGAIGIGFNVADRLRRRPRTEIPADGTFVFKLEHRGDVLNGTSYSVTVRGTFERQAVSGRVQGTASDSFHGTCRVNRTFTARLVRG